MENPNNNNNNNNPQNLHHNKTNYFRKRANTVASPGSAASPSSSRAPATPRMLKNASSRVSVDDAAAQPQQLQHQQQLQKPYPVDIGSPPIPQTDQFANLAYYPSPPQQYASPTPLALQQQQQQQQQQQSATRNRQVPKLEPLDTQLTDQQALNNVIPQPFSPEQTAAAAVAAATTTTSSSAAATNRRQPSQSSSANPKSNSPTSHHQNPESSSHRHSAQQQQQQQQQHQQAQQAQQQNEQPPQFHRRAIGDWDFIKTIGAGSMGKVKVAKHRRTEEVCAVKIVPRAAKLYQRSHARDPPPVDNNEYQKRVKEFEKEVARDKRTIREAALGKLLYHPFICRLYEMVPMTNHYYMLFEYVSGGQMLDYIVSHGCLKERHARKFTRGIASALDYCHRNNVVHRDLKIENIMISKSGDIKIIDFGLSNLYDNRKLLKTFCGSLYFAAPELLSADPYIGPEVDVWSFGVVLYVLVCGKVPFDDQSVSVLHEKIKKGNVEYPSNLSQECVDLLSRMLVVNTKKRATLKEIISHPWMNKNYDSKAQSYVPFRVPLELPLDGNVLKEIEKLELGNVDYTSRELTKILQTQEYAACVLKWYEKNSKYTNSGVPRSLQDYDDPHFPDPTNGFHPLISIYYLVDEMKKRQEAKEQAHQDQVTSPFQERYLQQQQQQAQRQAQIQAQTDSHTQQQTQAQAQAQAQAETQAQAQVQAQLQAQAQANAQANAQAHAQAQAKAQAHAYNQTRAESQLQSQQSSLVADQNRITEHSDRGHSQLPGLSEESSALPKPQQQQPEQVSPEGSQEQQPTNFEEVLSFPEAAHTSRSGNVPLSVDKPDNANVSQYHNVIPSQQLSPKRSKSVNIGTGNLFNHTEANDAKNTGINGLFRRLSGHRRSTSKSGQQHQPQQQHHHHPSYIPDSNAPPVPALPNIIDYSYDNAANNVQTSSSTTTTTPSPTSSAIATAAAAAGTATGAENEPRIRKSGSLRFTKNNSGVDETTELPRRGQRKPRGGHSRAVSASAATYAKNNVFNESNPSTAGNSQQSFNNAANESVNKNTSGNNLTVADSSATTLKNNNSNNQKKGASTVRAKTVGHGRSKSIGYKKNTYQDVVPPLPQISNEMYENVPEDEYEERPLSEAAIIEKAKRAEPGTMPSIEFPKTLYIKGFFSVQTTSTKPPPVIRQNVITCLERFGIDFLEVKGGFVCTFNLNKRDSNLAVSSNNASTANSNQTSATTQQEGSITNKVSTSNFSHNSSHSDNKDAVSSMSANSKGHRRKFSIGFKKQPPTPKIPSTPVLFSPSSPNPNHTFDAESSASLESLSGIGASDWILSSRINQGKKGGAAQRNPIRFEIHIVKIPLLSLYGVQLKKLSGNAWAYKTLADSILSELNL